MEAKIFLTEYAQETEEVLDDFFQSKTKEAAAISPIYQQMLEIFRDHLRGGKKARGALMVLGYQLAGGKEKKKILKASVFPEIIQSFLLIHDDIMDRDLIRRGKPTPQAVYTSFYRQKKFSGDADHFGLSLALDLGDLGMYLGQEALFASGFETQKIAEVLRLSNKVFQEVAVGQALDIFGEVSGEFSEDNVLKIHLMKTAGYSVSAPLQFGAILAGAEQKLLVLLENYGRAVGVAFQIHDDILGLFGEEEKLGKKAGGRDIKEGKETLLIVKAFEKVKETDKKFLRSVYGKKNITAKEVLRVQNLIKESGSLGYSVKKEKQLVDEGKRLVPKITESPELCDTLNSLADFMVQRVS